MPHFISFLAVRFEIELNSMRYYRRADLYIMSRKYNFIILVDITIQRNNAYSVGQASGGTAQCNLLVVINKMRNIGASVTLN